MPDGSVILVEMFGNVITRVLPDGSKQKIADTPGGPNGIAIGPDGAIYLCNNGGSFSEVDFLGLTFPGPFNPDNYIGGRIQRVDIATGKVTDLYTECDGIKLRGPNDLVFDKHGGMWFTDHGIREHRTADFTGIYYAKTDGSMIKEVIFPTESPNGIGLSPDGTKLYWAETHTGRVYHTTITGPGETTPFSPIDPSGLLCGLPGLQLFDSLAVDGDGNVCVATISPSGGITVISPTGEVVRYVESGDVLTTNICFGGPGLRTAYITRSGLGDVAVVPWASAGLALHR